MNPSDFCVRKGFQGPNRIEQKRILVRLCPRVLLWPLIWLAVSPGLLGPVASALEAGSAKAEITPPLGTPLAGKLERWGRGAETIHDPLWVRCLYLSDGENGLFLVSADLFAIVPELRARVIELAPRVVPAEHILMTATHTHSSMGGMERGLVRRLLVGRFSERVLEETAQQFAECMRQAHAARRRGAFGYGFANWQIGTESSAAETSVTQNRIGVLRMEDADGDPIAVVAHAAAIPNGVGRDEMLTLSADYPGYFYQRMEAALPSDCTVLFLNGASGDFPPHDPDAPTSWEQIQAMGVALGNQVLALNESIVCTDATLTIRTASVAMPPALGGSWLPEEANLAALLVNGLAVSFVPAAVSEPIGAAWREQGIGLGFQEHVTVGYANHFIGHIVPRIAYAADTSAARNHFYGPAMDDWMTAEVVDLLRGLQSSSGEPTTEGEASVDREAPDSASPIEQAGILTFEAAPDELVSARARGTALESYIAAAFKRRIADGCASGLLLSRESAFAHLPWFVDPSPIALPMMAFDVRPSWSVLTADKQAEIESLASGSNLPVEAVWLLHHEPALRARTGHITEPNRDNVFFAIRGRKAGADGMIAGARLFWEHDAPPVVIRRRDPESRSIVMISAPHIAGGLIGMNDAGVVICAARDTALASPTVDTVPAPVQLENILDSVDTLENALAMLSIDAAFRGYEALAADTSAEAASLLQFGETVESVAAEDEFILNSRAGSPGAEFASSLRVALGEFIRSESIVTGAEVENFFKQLPSLAPGSMDSGDSAGERGRYLWLVFEPRAGRLRAAIANAGAAPESFAMTLMDGGAT